MEELILREKSGQNVESKQTLGLTGKIEIEGKTRQNDENKQTFGLKGKIEIKDILRK